MLLVIAIFFLSSRRRHTRFDCDWSSDVCSSDLSPDLLQTDLSDLARLQLPAGLGLLPVVREADDVPATLPRRILFEGPVSGTGVAGGRGPPPPLPRCLHLGPPGGVDNGDAGAALAPAQPLWVDVSSGVEVRPGVKSPEQIVSFASAARAASHAPALRAEDPA